jgi:hypothetical protein
LVVANKGSNNVSVLLGNGNGTFQNAAVSFGVGSAPVAVAVADVNGDGRPDLVVANDRSNSVSVLLGNRNAATHFQVSAPASATAGTPFTLTVTALTAGNQLDALYTGTVHFKSSDGSALLPADYTFTLADAGSHTFTVTLNTAGSQTIRAIDKHTGSISGKAVVTVNAAAPAIPSPAGRTGRGGSPVVADAVAATAFRNAATPGTIVDAFGTLVSGYRRTAAFSSSDGTATLPENYTFVSTDEGTHTVTAVLTTAGSRTITVLDKATQGTGPATVTVDATRWPAPFGQPFDLDVDMLSPTGVDAFFAQ